MTDDHHHRRRQPRPPRRRVLVAGAGIAALEALLALRADAGDRVEIVLLTPGESFAQRPASVAECFGGPPAPQVDLAGAVAALEAVRVVDSIDGVDGEAGAALTRSGDRLPYDELLVAVGARPVPAVAGALVFRGGADVPALQATLRDIEARRISHVAFVLPSGTSWPLPAYDLALAAADWSRRRRLTARFSLLTAERAPLERFGPRAVDAIAGELRERGIELHCAVGEVSFRGGILASAETGSDPIRADRVIALPRLRGPRLDGLPSDADGFIPVDAHGRVRDVPAVYAAGDATCGALKNGALATAQADAAAAVIAQRAGAAIAPQPFPTAVRGLLFTDGPPLYVRSDGDAGTLPGAFSRGRDHGPEARVPHSLWWPPPAASGRHLARFVSSPPGASRSRAARREQLAAVELTLLMADCDAHCGDHRLALHALDCAETLAGTLPAQYAAKRTHWRAALADTQPQPGGVYFAT